MLATSLAQLAPQRNLSRIVLICALAAFFILFYVDVNHLPGSAPVRDAGAAPTVAKVSMLYGGSNSVYVRAVSSHERHAARHGYPVHILRHEVAKGYWNKPSYILSFLIQELTKAPANRVQWMMWFDADSIIINPTLPLDIFLPPHDFADVHFLGTKDHNGLNTGIFFLRVHEWSVKMMAKALAYPMFHPEDNLGTSPDQVAMARVFNDTEFGPNVLYQPRIWYNAYEFRHGYEGQQGDLLVHFPGLEEDRWKLMSDWLDTVEGPAARKWETALARTRYPEQIDQFWTQVRECRTTLADVTVQMNATEYVPSNIRIAADYLTEVLSLDTGEIETMRLAVQGVKQAMYLASWDSRRVGA